jgi:hypothetical protein
VEGVWFESEAPLRSLVKEKPDTNPTEKRTAALAARSGAYAAESLKATSPSLEFGLAFFEKCTNPFVLILA